MEECLTYFRAALNHPGSVQTWPLWWAEHEQLVREVFPRLEYLRLRARGLMAAEDYLRRTGQLAEPIQLDPEFIAQLRSVDWFAECGQPLRDCPAGVTLASSWREALAVSESPGSEAFRETPAIDLYNHVAIADREVHIRWNDRAMAMNQWLDESGLETEWEARLLTMGAGVGLIPTIRSDVLFAWLAHEHRSIPECPTEKTQFFSWYRLGRMVCGWSGEWPEGSLVVY